MSLCTFTHNHISVNPLLDRESFQIKCFHSDEVITSMNPALLWVLLILTLKHGIQFNDFVYSYTAQCVSTSLIANR